MKQPSFDLQTYGVRILRSAIFDNFDSIHTHNNYKEVLHFLIILNLKIKVLTNRTITQYKGRWFRVQYQTKEWDKVKLIRLSRLTSTSYVKINIMHQTSLHHTSNIITSIHNSHSYFHINNHIQSHPFFSLFLVFIPFNCLSFTRFHFHFHSTPFPSPFPFHFFLTSLVWSESICESDQIFLQEIIFQPQIYIYTILPPLHMSSDIGITEEREVRHIRLGGSRAASTPPTTAAKSKDITVSQKMISAMLGSFITSLVVTPFDVIRIRIQQQEILPQNNICCQGQLQETPELVRNTLMKGPESIAKLAETSPELFWLHKDYCKTAHNCTRITSTFQGFMVVSRGEGLATLWRGLSLTLFMAVPSNIIYFTGYDYISDHSPIRSHALNPLFCGAFARLISATVISPVELVKTRLQSIPSDPLSSSKILSNLLKDSLALVKLQGVKTLFTGLQITLWRDVPFSGIYWLNYEYFKKTTSNLLKADFKNTTSNEDHKVFASSFISGSVSGLIAAFVTNPFDVGKTRMQICDIDQNPKQRPSMFKFLYGIYRKEGVRALYSGFPARALKIAPACAIMISSYEIGKKFFKNEINKENI